MSIRFKIAVLGSLLGALVVTGSLIWLTEWYDDRTEVVFLNVGQGDAILISHGTDQILIDSGRSGATLLSALGRRMPFWDRRIEVVIPTHPDADHVGGLADLFRAYRVGAILSTGVTSDTEVVRNAERAREHYGHPEPVLASRGSTVRLSPQAMLTFEYPEEKLPEHAKDTNGTSIVARFVYGETSFLLTGDLADEERKIAHTGLATILKAAHHGSKSSTSMEFLELIRPQEAVISVGKNNYGHPSPEVLDRLRERGVVVRRTDESGDIRYLCSKETMSCQYVP